MALYAVQAVNGAGVTPAAITPAASDTISKTDIQSRGVILRVITTGTATNVSVSDPNLTKSGNAGTIVPVACPSTGVRMILVPASAVDPATGVATVSYSGARTGVTVEAYRR